MSAIAEASFGDTECREEDYESANEQNTKLAHPDAGLQHRLDEVLPPGALSAQEALGDGEALVGHGPVRLEVGRDFEIAEARHILKEEKAASQR